MIRFSKTYPSFLTVKEGIFLPLRLSCKESSTFLTKPLFPQGREDATALRCSEPLRSKVGGPSKVSPDRLCGVNRLAEKEDDTSFNLIEKPLDSSLFTLRSSLIKAVSIQWLSKHYDEIEEEPGMIVID